MISVTFGKRGLGTYHIGCDPQNMDKRPLGPPARPHRLINNPSDRNDTLSNDDEGKEAHANVEMSILESYCWVNGRNSHDCPHLNRKKNEPHRPNP